MMSRDKCRPEPAPARLCSNLESVSGDSSAEWALSLLAEATPYQEPPGRRERIWQRLRGEQARASAPLRLAFAAAVLGVFGLFASAAFAHWPRWLAQAIGTVAPESSVDHSRHSSPVGQVRPGPRDSPVVLAPPVRPGPALPLPPPTTNDAPILRKGRALKPVTPQDTGPLLNAMRALRMDHDPTRARELLTAYLDQHPRGELAEEALVMLVEAAVAHHDSDAPALAARYFRLYPSGEFRGQVERQLAASDKRP